MVISSTQESIGEKSNKNIQSREDCEDYIDFYNFKEQEKLLDEAAKGIAMDSRLE